MGILKNREEKRNEKVPEAYRFKNKNKENVLVYDFKYQEGKSNLITAKIKIDDSAESYICFSIPQSMSIRDILKLEVIEGLDKLDKLENLEEGYNFLGGIIRNVNQQNKEEKFFLTNSLEDKKYVDEKLNTELKKQQNDKAQDEFRKKLQEQAKISNEPKSKEELQQEFEQKLEQEAKDLPREILVERQLRRENPKMELKDIYINDDIYGEQPQLYSYYEGTDIATGEVIRLNETSCRLIDDKYIYTTFISHADKEGVKPVKSKIPYGNPVIFELPFELEKAVSEKRMDQIMPVLELVSKNPETLLEKDKMKFLGTVEYGKAKRNVISNIESKKYIVQEIHKYQEMINSRGQTER